MANKTISEMRHDIIEYAINLDYWLEEEIMSHFGFDAYGASYHNLLDKERKTFKECFLKRIDFSVKLGHVIKIIKSIGEVPYPGFKGDGLRFTEIRNKFAHQAYPIIMPEFSCSPMKEITESNQQKWKEEYKEAKILFKKIMEELDNKFYTKGPRRRRYRSWALLEKLDIINRYEGFLKKEKE